MFQNIVIYNKSIFLFYSIIQRCTNWLMTCQSIWLYAQLQFNLVRNRMKNIIFFMTNSRFFIVGFRVYMAIKGFNFWLCLTFWFLLKRMSIIKNEDFIGNKGTNKLGLQLKNTWYHNRIPIKWKKFNLIFYSKIE